MGSMDGKTEANIRSLQEVIVHDIRKLKAELVWKMYEQAETNTN